MEKDDLSLQQEENELQAYEDLETAFSQTISQLVLDRSLDQFREHYELLHNQITKSHEKNMVLIQKCKSLNNEILANTNKISSILSLSQDDQRTIAGLKHEFEKAWKMVEVSQEREEKTKEVIESLKLEISNLSHAISAGKSDTISQQNSLEEINSHIIILKKEIALQDEQIQNLQDHLSSSKQNTQELLEIVENKKNTLADLEKQLKELQNVSESSKMESVNNSNEISSLKENILDMKKNNVVINESIKQQKLRNMDLEYMVHEYQRSVLSSKNDLNDINNNKNTLLKEKKLKLNMINNFRKKIL